MRVIKVNDEAYYILEHLAKETESTIAEVASKLIINKDKQLRFENRVVKNISIAG